MKAIVFSAVKHGIVVSRKFFCCCCLLCFMFNLRMTNSDSSFQSNVSVVTKEVKNEKKISSPT